MDIRAIENLIITAIKAVMAESGRRAVDVTPDCKPLLDLEEFDSLNAVEVTVYIEEKLGLELHAANIFVQGDRLLSIKDAAQRVLKAISK